MSKKWTINLDEILLRLDRSSQKQSGCPMVTFFNAALPIHGITLSKTSQSSTLITRNSAAREVLPPHYQLSMIAKSFDHERIWLEIVKFMKKERGLFGLDAVKTLTCTFGLNEKGEWIRMSLIKHMFLILSFHSWCSWHSWQKIPYQNW